jgi:hypothetical protein
MNRAALARFVLTLLSSLTWAASLSAQDPWEWDIEAGGNLFFGEVEQTTVTAGATVEKADSAFELSAGVRFDYGETHDVESGAAVVSRRSWLAATSFDWVPQGKWSEFLFGTGERSFEKRIDFRYNGGIGLKHTFVRADRSRIDLSGALLAEQTFPQGRTEDSPSSDVLARLSVRFRLRHTFGDERLSFDTRNTYGPKLGEASNYTVRSVNSLDYHITSVIAVGVNLDYDYDSLSIERGARSNSTGKVYLALKATF